MTRFPKGPGDGRYRVEAGRPKDQTDTIVDYYDVLAEAEAAAHGVALRPDVCRGIIYDTIARAEIGCFISTEQCSDCDKCEGTRSAGAQSNA